MVMKVVMHKGCACATSEVSWSDTSLAIYANLSLPLFLFVVRCEGGLCSVSVQMLFVP